MGNIRNPVITAMKKEPDLHRGVRQGYPEDVTMKQRGEKERGGKVG